MGIVREWVTKARCIDCSGIYEINPRYPFQKRCNSCSKAHKKMIKRRDRVQIVSFFLFPVGFLLYFLLRYKKPDLAKTALKAALTSFFIMNGVYLFLILFEKLFL